MRLEALRGKTVLVTGASGFIGRVLSARLREIEGLRLVLLSRSGGSFEAPGAHWIDADLNKLTAGHFDPFGIDIAIHLAAFIPKSVAEADDADAVYAANINGMRRLLDSLPNHLQRFVFISSVDVYAPDSTHCLSERTPTAPATLYAASKLFGETLTRVVAEQRGWGHVILRLGHIYGEGEHACAKLIPATIERLLAGEPPRVHGSGDELRDFLHVRDAAEAIARAAAHPDPGLGTMNVVSGRSLSVRSLIHLLAKLCGWNGEIEYVDAPRSGRSFCFNNVRMKTMLGEWDQVDLHTGLLREIAERKERRHAA